MNVTGVVQKVRAWPKALQIGAAAGAGVVALILILGIGYLLASLLSSKRGDGVVSVTTDRDFGSGVAVSVQGRVVVVTSYDLVRGTNEGKAYVYQEVGDATVAVGFAARVIAVDRDARIAALLLEGVTPSDVRTIKLRDVQSPAANQQISIAGSRARYSSEITRTVLRSKSTTVGILRTPGTVSGAATARPGETMAEGSVLVSGEDTTGPGFIGAPVFDSDGRLLGLSVGTGTNNVGLRVTPAASLRKMIDALKESDFEEQEAAAVGKKLAERLEKTAAQLKKNESQWMRLTWPRFVNDPRPDRITALNELPKLEPHIAPSDLARLASRVSEISRSLQEKRPRSRDDTAVKVDESQIERAVGFELLRRLLGTEPPKVGNVAKGARRNAYQVEVVDGWGEAHELCVLVEHGEVFPSLFPCRESSSSDVFGSSTSKQQEYPWLADRASGERLVGKWRLQTKAEEEKDRARKESSEPCSGNSFGACFSRSTVLTITSVKGSAVNGKLSVLAMVNMRTEYGGSQRCEVASNESLVGSLVRGEARLLGRSPENITVGTAQGEKVEDAQKRCRRMEASAGGAIPHFQHDGSIGVHNGVLDLLISNVDPANDSIEVTPAWHGALTPWMDVRTDYAQPVKLRLKWDGNPGE